MLRVNKGEYKGKKLKRVASPVVRPMPAKLKESLFNIIDNQVPGVVFLDGFAGTGSVGIEALSRGAEFGVFVDEYYPAVKVIKKNLAQLGAEKRARVIHKEFNRAIIRVSKEGMAFDLIFLDPPYKLLEERNPLKVIKKREVLKKGGIVILRQYYKTPFEGSYYQLKRKVTLGDDTLSFYQ